MDVNATVEGAENGYRPLHVAVICGHAHICQLLLRHGADVDAVDSEVPIESS